MNLGEGLQADIDGHFVARAGAPVIQPELWPARLCLRRSVPVKTPSGSLRPEKVAQFERYHVCLPTAAGGNRCVVE